MYASFARLRGPNAIRRVSAEPAQSLFPAGSTIVEHEDEAKKNHGAYHQEVKVADQIHPHRRNDACRRGDQSENCERSQWSHDVELIGVQALLLRAGEARSGPKHQDK